MKPEFISAPHISSYSFFLFCGILFGYLAARARAGRFGIEARHVDNLALLLAVAGLAGARFFGRLFVSPATGVWDALQLWKGGALVFYGSAIFGALAMAGYCWARGASIRSMANLLAPSLAIGLSFGRVGCFLAGCCWGDVCVDPVRLASLEDPQTVRQIQTVPALSGAEWAVAVSFPKYSHPFDQHEALGLITEEADRSLPVHPTQLYEAAFAMALALVLMARSSGASRRRGEFFILIVAYAAWRFAVEFLRGDTGPVGGSLSLSQVISLAALAGAALWIIGKRLRPGAESDAPTNGPGTAVPAARAEKADLV